MEAFPCGILIGPKDLDHLSVGLVETGKDHMDGYSASI